MQQDTGFWSRVLFDVRAKQLRQRHRRHVARGELAAYMGPVEWSQLEAVLVALAPRRMLEWGAGGGTRAVLAACSTLERYVSIEHDRGWYERLATQIHDPRLQLEHVAANLSEPPPVASEKAARERHEAWVDRCERDPEAMRDYVARPAQLIADVDLVLIDGRARSFCVVEGHRLLRPGGVLLVHDAQRPAYRAALDRVALDSAGPAVFLEPWELGQLALVRKRGP